MQIVFLLKRTFNSICKEIRLGTKVMPCLYFLKMCFVLKQHAISVQCGHLWAKSTLLCAVANLKKNVFNIYSSDGKIIAMDFVSIWSIARKIPSTDTKYTEPLLATPIEELVNQKTASQGLGTSAPNSHLSVVTWIT